MIFMLFNTFFLLTTFSLPCPVFVIKKLMSSAFVESGLYQILTFPAPHQSRRLTLSPLLAPPRPPRREFRETLLFVHFSFSISNLSQNELLLYLWMTHIKFSPINFEMDFEMGTKLLSNAWESHLDYCISLIT